MTGPRPFRFGIILGEVPDRVAWGETLRRAEDCGFDIVLQGDHLGGGMAPFSALAMAAAVTRLRVGTLVLANDYRHPLLTAQEAATVAGLSGGRFELGIGAGWIEEHYRRAGLPFDPPAVRVARLEEAVRIIKGFWSGVPFRHEGEHYRVAIPGRPAPLPALPPPLLIAGSGPRLLRLAGRAADIVGITATLGRTGFAGFSAGLLTAGPRLPDQLGWIREGAAERFPSVELNVLVHIAALTDDPRGFAERIGGEQRVPPEVVLQSPHVVAGSPAQVRDLLVQRRERFGLSYFVFPAASLADVGGIVAGLAGQ